MRRSCKILIKSIIIFFSTIAVWASLTYYLQLKQVHEWHFYELTLIRGISISLLNVLFYGIVLVTSIRIYRIIFASLAVFGIIAWNLSHLNNTLELGLLSIVFDDFLEIVLFISTAVIAPGMLVLIAYYIKKYTSKFERNFIGKYHIHEGFFGILLIVLVIFLFIIRTIVIQFEVFLNELKVFLAVIMIFIYFFLFFGGFFILRDIKDVVHLNFIKKIEKSQSNEEQHSDVFNSIKQDNLSFFKVIKLPIFPIGIITTSLSFSMIIYGTKFVPREFLNSELILNYGYLFSFIAGSLIGFDWMRVFKLFYPIYYTEIEQKITELKNRSI
ncbi:MAG: hypothetical protein ACTSQW_05315 [Promethearchaeota archaeon]